MRNKLLILFILIILFLAFIVIRFFIFDKQNNYGRLKVLTSPTMSVFINNLIVGKTPYEDKLKVGEHILKLIPEGIATDTASWNGKIKIFKNALTYVSFELGSSDILTSGVIFTTEKIQDSLKNNDYGEIYVETEPQGAIVMLDNDEKGIAPLILQDVSPGTYELAVFMPGFFKKTQKIKVDSKYRVNSFFKLALDPSQKKLEDIKKESTDSAKTDKTYILINNNPQGWLRVRTGPSIQATEEAKVKTGEKFEFLEEENGWYKIKFNGNKDSLIEGEFDEGWVSKEYATKE